jgi:hypothetical protein
MHPWHHFKDVPTAFQTRFLCHGKLGWKTIVPKRVSTRCYNRLPPLRGFLTQVRAEALEVSIVYTLCPLLAGIFIDLHPSSIAQRCPLPLLTAQVRAEVLIVSVVYTLCPLLTAMYTRSAPFVSAQVCVGSMSLLVYRLELWIYTGTFFWLTLVPSWSTYFWDFQTDVAHSSWSTASELQGGFCKWSSWP